MLNTNNIRHCKQFASIYSRLYVLSKLIVSVISETIGDILSLVIFIFTDCARNRSRHKTPNGLWTFGGMFFTQHILVDVKIDFVSNAAIILEVL